MPVSRREIVRLFLDAMEAVTAPCEALPFENISSLADIYRAYLLEFTRLEDETSRLLDIYKEYDNPTQFEA